MNDLFKQTCDELGRKLCPNDPPPVASTVHVSVVTSCTADKKLPPRGVQIIRHYDFKSAFQSPAGKELLLKQVKALEPYRRPAEEMYTGQQHSRLMRGIYMARQSRSVRVGLHIVSAGWGFLDGAHPIVPYDCSFHDMDKRALRTWSTYLGLRHAFTNWLESADGLKLVLLGDSYLDAVGVTAQTTFPYPTIVLCSPRRARELARTKNVFTVLCGTCEAAQYGCSAVYVKGEVGARILTSLIEDEDFRGRASFALAHRHVVMETEQREAEVMDDADSLIACSSAD